MKVRSAFVASFRGSSAVSAATMLILGAMRYIAPRPSSRRPSEPVEAPADPVPAQGERERPRAAALGSAPEQERGEAAEERGRAVERPRAPAVAAAHLDQIDPARHQQLGARGEQLVAAGDGTRHELAEDPARGAVADRLLVRQGTGDPPVAARPAD